MQDIITATKDELKDIIKAGINKAISAGSLAGEFTVDFNIEIPVDREHGDFSTNVAMVSAKVFRLSPINIAEIICSNLVLENSSFESCSIAGCGFINLFVKKSWFHKIVIDILDKNQDYGKSDYLKDKKIMVEFVSANPTGPMHIGNSRGGAIGDSLSSILEFAGAFVTKEFYINDTGNQIERFGDSLYARYMQIYKEDVEFPEDGYHGEDIKLHAKIFSDLYKDRLLKENPKVAKKELIDYALPINIANLKSDLEKYRINYDVWYKESYLYRDKVVDKIVQILKSKGFVYEKDEALWYDLKRLGFEKDEVLIRSNKIPTYFLADIAYHYNKFVERNFDKVIDIWGADHHGHVLRLKSALDDIGVESRNLDIILMQMVRLVKDSKPVKVSKRTGKSITLVDLLQEVPICAARFFFNLKEASSHFDFDLDLAVEESSKNPVYYVQYAYARACSIIKKFKESDVDLVEINLDVLKSLNDPFEFDLIRYMGEFPLELLNCIKDYDPSKITRYSIELATLFHKFYSSCRVNCDDKILSNARYSICLSFKIVLRNILDILKIEALEVM